MELEHSFESLPLLSTRSVDPGPIQRLRSAAKTRWIRARLSWILRFGRRRLSRDAVLDQVYRRLLEAFEELAAAA